VEQLLLGERHNSATSFRVLIRCNSRDSSVSIVTRLQTGRLVFDSG